MKDLQRKCPNILELLKDIHFKPLWQILRQDPNFIGSGSYF